MEGDPLEMTERSVRDRQARQTRARIAEVALGLFVSQGYAQTTIDQIAEAAGKWWKTVRRLTPAASAI